MTFWSFDAPQPGQSYEYPSLGFVAADGAILDGDASTPKITNAPGPEWSVVASGPESGITRVHDPEYDPDYTEPADGSLLVYSDAANAHVNMSPADFVSGPGKAPLDAAYVGINPAALVKNLPAQCIIAHRGGPLVAPEESLEAFRQAIAYGAHAIEMDARMMADGALTICHDDTTDRTTNRSGTVASLTTASLQQVKIKASTLLAPAWVDVSMPTLDQVLRELGNKVCMFIQAVSGPSGSELQVADAIIAAVSRAGVSPATIVINADQTPVIAKMNTAGFFTAAQIASGSTAADAIATGAQFWTLARTEATQAIIDAAHAGGLKVLTWTSERRNERDADFALGADGVYTDDPGYLLGTVESKADMFSSQVPQPGLQANASGLRGAYISPDWWGITPANGGVIDVDLIGALAPTDPSNYVLTFTAQIDDVNGGDTTRGIMLYFGTNDKPYTDKDPTQFDGPDGYTVLVRANGQTGIYLKNYTGKVATTLKTASIGSAVTLGSQIGVKVTIAPTAITVERTDAGKGTPATATDATFRHLRYLNFGRFGAGVRFRGVAVT